MGIRDSFVAREAELAILKDAYEDPRFQFVAIYGRRRVGKTYLIKRFVSDKRNVFFFTGRETTVTDNLAYLSGAIERQLVRPEDYRENKDLLDAERRASRNLPSPAGDFIYRDLGSAFEALFVLASRLDREKGRPVIVIDEYPYLAKSDPSASSVLQTLIDRIKDESDLMLILCGSSLSFMKREVLGRKSPLYGRRTRQIELKPMDVFDGAKVLAKAGSAAEMAGTDDAIDKEGDASTHTWAQYVIQVYGVTGGIPLYLQQFDPAHPFAKDLATRVFAQDAFLFSEPQNYLLQSVQAHERYNAVLFAVASGRTQPSTIADAAGINANSVGTYLRRLAELQIVKLWRPVPAHHGGKPGYRLIDNLFRFWYDLSVRYADAIEDGRGAAIASHVLRQEFPSYMGLVFEDVCRQWLRRELATGAIAALEHEVGKWWGTDPTTRSQADIDVVATTHDGPLVLGECKWRDEPMDVGVLRVLERRSAMFDEKEKLLFGFSRSGFTQGAKAYAKERSWLRLVALNELFLPW